jgi:hypothetical protein
LLCPRCTSQPSQGHFLICTTSSPEATSISTRASVDPALALDVGSQRLIQVFVFRRVPLPRDLLPYLPATINGRLFTRIGSLKRTSDAASKRLMRFLRDDCGIADTRKVIHSLRHRAKDRSRAVGCPLNVQYELFGHEERTIAAGYGVGSPVRLLKKWIDRIGF